MSLYCRSAAFAVCALITVSSFFVRPAIAQDCTYCSDHRFLHPACCNSTQFCCGEHLCCNKGLLCSADYQCVENTPAPPLPPGPAPDGAIRWVALVNMTAVAPVLVVRRSAAPPTHPPPPTYPGGGALLSSVSKKHPKRGGGASGEADAAVTKKNQKSSVGARHGDVVVFFGSSAVMGFEYATGKPLYTIDGYVVAGQNTVFTLPNGRQVLYFYSSTPAALVAADPFTGKVLWTYALVGSCCVSPCPPLAIGEIVVIATGTEAIALDAATGAQVWSDPEILAGNCLAFAEQSTFVFATTNAIIALESTTGNVTWAQTGLLFTAGAWAHDGVLVYAWQGTSNPIVAFGYQGFDVATGNLTWQRNYTSLPAAGGGAIPGVFGGLALAILPTTTAVQLIALDASSGDVAWTWSVDASAPSYTVLYGYWPDASTSMVYVSQASNLVGVKNGATLWNVTFEPTTSLTFAGNRLFTTNTTDYSAVAAIALSASTGEQVWTRPTQGMIPYPPTAADVNGAALDTAFVASNDLSLYAVENH